MRRTAAWAGALVGVVCLTNCSTSSDHGADRPTAPTSTRQVTVLTQEQTAAAVFGPTEVPATWTATGQVAIDGRQSGGIVATVSRGYRAPDLASIIGIGVRSFQSVSVAHNLIVKKNEGEYGTSVTGADEAFRSSCKDCVEDSIQFRVGTVVAWVNFNTDNHAHKAPHLGPLGGYASLLAERIGQILAGQRPTVTLR